MKSSVRSGQSQLLIPLIIILGSVLALAANTTINAINSTSNGSNTSITGNLLGIPQTVEQSFPIEVWANTSLELETMKNLVRATLILDNGTLLENQEIDFFLNDTMLGSGLTNAEGFVDFPITDNGTLKAVFNGDSYLNPSENETGMMTEKVAEDLEQGKAEIGKPVKWTMRFSFKNNIQSDALKSVPKKAFNVSTTEEDTSKGKKYVVEYFTDAPQAYENIINKYKKTVTVSSDIDYTNIKTYTDITDSPKNSIRLYWLVDNSKIDVTNDPSINLTLVDTDGNGLIDRLEWITPHTSNQTFEVDIIILNPYTYLRNGENWIVAFNTTGQADLIINSTNANWTEFLTDNPSTYDEMKFLDLSCGNASLKGSLELADENENYYNYSQLTESDSIKVKKLLIRNYSCDDTGYITNNMLKTGYAILQFSFGDQTAYARDPDFTPCQINITWTANYTYNITNITSNSGGNNTYYCLNQSWYIVGVHAINFTNIQNSTLDCLGYNINGSRTTSTYGVYILTSSINNTVKNCNLTNFYGGIYIAGSSNNNTLYNDNTSSNSLRGIILSASNFTNISYSQSSYNTQYGVWLSNSYYNNISSNNFNSNSIAGVDIVSGNNNTFFNNSVNGNSAYGVISAGFNNTFTGGSIFGGNTADYNPGGTDASDTFTNTNFTGSRKIHFSDSTSWFNYQNDSTQNLWLDNNVSAATTISRTLTYWDTYEMTWNDSASAAANATYNITGLVTNKNYTVYDGTVAIYSGDTALNATAGYINFTISLDTTTREIKANTTLNECTVLNHAGKTYSLSGNVSSPGTCFNVSANNVTLDCQGYYVNYSYSVTGYAVNDSGYNNVTIKNCNIVQSSTSPDTYAANSYGIYGSGMANSTVQNNTVITYGVDSHGIFVNSSSSNNISYNNVTTSGSGDGIYLLTSSNNTIANNNATSLDDYYGIFLNSSSNNTVTNNRADGGMFGSGITSSGSNNNNISYNYANGGIGIELGGSNNTVTNNNATAFYGSGEGIILSGSNNIVSYNNVSAKSYGIGLSGSYNNVSYNNVTAGGGGTGYGIYFVSGSYNNVSYNSVNASDRGIYIVTSSAQNVFSYNNITASNYGIDIADTCNSNTILYNNVTTSGSGDYGIYIGFTNANNVSYNSVNSNIYGIYVSQGSPTYVSYNNVTTSGTGNGITIGSSATCTVSYNNVNASGSGGYGIYFTGSSGNNVLYNNVTASGGGGYGIYFVSSSSNNVTGGSIRGTIDYALSSADTSNNFTNTNFTATRKIYFSDTTSWFKYQNDSSQNIWLKTNVSATANLTRTLNSWSQANMSWNDSADSSITANYNITGLLPNTVYNVYNFSASAYMITTDANGALNFTIGLNATSREIKVNTYCNFITWTSNYTYNITNNNTYYCLNQSWFITKVTAINFTNIQNSTLDCLGYSITGNQTTGAYGALLTTSSINNTVKNCNFTNFTYGIYISVGSDNSTIFNNVLSNESTYGMYQTNSNYANISNNIANYNSGIYLTGTSRNNVLINNTFNGLYGNTYGVRLYSSNNTLINNTANYHRYCFDISGNYNTFINNTAKPGSGSFAWGIQLSVSAYNNFTNNNFIGGSTAATDYVFYIASSNYTSVTGGSIYNSTSSGADYEIGANNGVGNNFTNTNFTGARKITFTDSTGWFNYQNDSTQNLWLSNNVSSATAVTLARTLNKWNQYNVSWNETTSAATTANYNVSGLVTNKNYTVYNNSVLRYTINASSCSCINFTIDISTSSQTIQVNATDSESPTYSLNSTNSTSSGTPVMHRLNWNDNGGLSGYIFSFWNGTDYNRTPTSVYDKNGEEPSIYWANRTIDGSTGGSDWEDLQNIEHWIVYDLNASFNISKIWLYTDDPSVEYDPCSVNAIYITNDPNNPGSSLGSCALSGSGKAWRGCSFTPKGGRYIKITINVSDGSGGCGYIQLTGFYEFTATVGFVNDTWAPMTGSANWSNVTKIVNSTLGSTIKWCVYANDTLNNWNGTSCSNPFSYTTIETISPTYSSNSTNYTAGATAVQHNLYWQDNTNLSRYIFQFCNGTWNGTHCVGNPSFIHTPAAFNNTTSATLSWSWDPTNAWDNNYNDSSTFANLTSLYANKFANLYINYTGVSLGNIIFYTWNNTNGSAGVNSYLYIYNWSASNGWTDAYAINWTTGGFGWTNNSFSLTQSDFISNGLVLLRFLEAGDNNNAGRLYIGDVYVYQPSAWLNNSWQLMPGAANWSNVTVTVNSTEGAVIAWCVYANDIYNNWNSTSCQNPFTYTIVAADTTAPTYSKNQTSTTEAGTSCSFQLEASDNYKFYPNGKYLFSTNNTGTWSNATWTSFPDNNPYNMTNTTTLNSTVGTKVAWCFYFNDTTGNPNNTNCLDGNQFIVTTTDTTPPTYSTPKINTTIAGRPANFSLYWNDNSQLAGYIFSTNNTGPWTNSSYVSFSGIGNTAWNVTTLNSTLGTVVAWCFYANDTSGKMNGTNCQSPNYLKTGFGDVKSSSSIPFYSNIRTVCRDATGRIHVTWLYNSTTVRYANSSDGVIWTSKDINNTADGDKEQPSISCDGNNVYIAYRKVSYINIYKSADNGANFNLLSDTIGWNSIGNVQVEARGNRIYVVYGYATSIINVHFINSTDGGSTWSDSKQILNLVSGSLTDFLSFAVNGTGSASDKLYIVSRSGNFPNYVVFTNSTDSGATWSPSGTSGIQIINQTGSTDAPSIAFSGNNLYVVASDNNGAIWFTNSTDNGATWTQNYTINTSAGTNRYAAVTIDSSGNPVVLWEQNSQNSNYDIVYRKWNGTAWTPTSNVYNVTNDNVGNEYVNTKYSASNNYIDAVWRSGTSCASDSACGIQYFNMYVGKPVYSLNSTNYTIGATVVQHSLYWQNGVSLSGYIFQFCNGTWNGASCLGATGWQNVTTQPMTGAANWSNWTVTINSTVGAVIAWCVYANDTSNNWNGTSCSNPFTYTIISISFNVTLPDSSLTSSSASGASTSDEEVNSTTPNDKNVTVRVKGTSYRQNSTVIGDLTNVSNFIVGNIGNVNENITLCINQTMSKITLFGTKTANPYNGPQTIPACSAGTWIANSSLPTGKTDTIWIWTNFTSASYDDSTVRMLYINSTQSGA